MFSYPIGNDRVLYRGTGLKLTNYENHQVFGILRANEESFVNNYIDNKPTTIG